MVLRGEAKEAIIDEEDVLRIKGRVCVPRVDNFIHTILTSFKVFYTSWCNQDEL